MDTDGRLAGLFLGLFVARTVFARLSLAPPQILAQFLGQPFRAFVLVGHDPLVAISVRSAKAKLDKMARTPP